jgi:nucleolar MIF4G domain-containing protein 1
VIFILIYVFLPVISPEALRFTLADIRSSSTKGKWWLVGSAWAGNPLVDGQAEGAGGAGDKLSAKAKDEDEALVKLARQQGMNTDVRKSVFIVLMSSEVRFFRLC